MKHVKKLVSLLLCLCMAGMMLTGCSSVGNGKRIIRIAHMQSETHPEHLGLLKFKEYVEENLGDKYEVQIYPNELLGGAQKAIELTQTGAIDFTVAGTANLETFADIYEVFSMPYLFTSEEAYHATMQDTEYMNNVYKSTDEAGFRVLTWYNAGSRSFYATKPINEPADLKGLKIRVQQSPASIAMANAFGAAASPMSFGKRDHMRMSFLSDKITGKPKMILEIAIELLIMVMVGFVMIFGGFSIMQLTMTQATASLGIPMGVIYTIIPILGCIIFVYSILNIIDLLHSGSAEEGDGRKEESA